MHSRTVALFLALSLTGGVIGACEQGVEEETEEIAPEEGVEEVEPEEGGEGGEGGEG